MCVCFTGIIIKLKSSSGLFMLFFLLCNFSFPKDHPVTNYTIYFRAYSGYLMVILNRNLQIHWPEQGTACLSGVCQRTVCLSEV